ncbi:Gfo/Idh/MocA family oxidoreductase [Nocardioides aquaticus]|uniref:Gfo/Idh/MocA family protein n=1 Tax=Nocardioides aquaticus TaxID=160826 RepID=UPI0031DBAEBF
MSTPSPGTPGPVGWGVLAAGKIARTFAADLAHVPGARLAAVGARSADRAAALVHDVLGPDPVDPPAVHGSYAALVADPAVDVVYVASPHSLHLDHVRLALEAGKHVLCEKPVALRAADWETMVALAAEHDRFLMEAMWTACPPIVIGLVEALATGAYGTPRHLRAELGFRVDAGPEDRLVDPALGAGALLDMGIYPLTLAHLLLGPAEETTALAALSDDAVDLDVTVLSRHPGGALATSSASLTSWSDRTAALATDRGRIDLLGSFHHPDGAVFVPAAGDDEQGEAHGGGEQHLAPVGEVLGRGYGNEAAEVGRCLRAGLRESPMVPHAQTTALMRQLDAVRAQVGIRYPGD